MFWRWVLIGVVFLYVLCGIGVFFRNVGDKDFQHHDHQYRAAAYDAALWPREVPALARQAWRAAIEFWEEF